MVERGERLRLTLEAPQALLVHRDVSGQDLDRHFALEAGVLGPVHLPHPTGPEKTDDLVEGEGLPGVERHD